jgi:hypothetical protein
LVGVAVLGGTLAGCNPGPSNSVTSPPPQPLTDEELKEKARGYSATPSMNP